MKRCIKWVINWFADWIDRIREFDSINLIIIVIYAISGLLGIAFAISIFVCADKVPATPSDYEQLEEQINTIQQNPELLLETDCNINVNGEVITVEVENDECKMIAKYDKDFEVLSTSKKDESVPWLFVLVISLILGVLTFYCTSRIFLLMFFVAQIEACLFFSAKFRIKDWIYEKVKKLKIKFQKK